MNNKTVALIISMLFASTQAFGKGPSCLEKYEAQKPNVVQKAIKTHSNLSTALAVGLGGVGFGLLGEGLFWIGLTAATGGGVLIVGLACLAGNYYIVVNTGKGEDSPPEQLTVPGIYHDSLLYLEYLKAHGGQIPPANELDRYRQLLGLYPKLPLEKMRDEAPKIVKDAMENGDLCWDNPVSVDGLIEMIKVKFEAEKAKDQPKS